jgi:hypothetical protein
VLPTTLDELDELICIQSEARSNCGTFEIPLDLSEVGEAPETRIERWKI